MELKLKILSGSHAGKEMRITKDKFLVGRSEECHLRPNSEKISRHHCVFLLGDGRATLRDLGSRNGTLINGEKAIGEVDLAVGDLLEIGPLQFEVSLIVGAELPVEAPEFELQGNGVSVGMPEPSPVEPARAPQASPERSAPQPAAAAENRRPAAPEPNEDLATWLLDSLTSKSEEDTKDFSKTDIALKPPPGAVQGSGAPPLPGERVNAQADALKKLAQKRKR